MMIVLTLSYCVSEQFKIIDNWEMRSSAHKIMELHLRNSNLPADITIDNKKYKFSQTKSLMKVEVNGKTFYAQKSP